MTDFLVAWWPLFVLIHLPWIMNRIVVTLYTRTSSRLDHETPDTLPETAGQWLERQIVALGLGVRSIVTDRRARRSVNAFHPDALTIELTEQTYFKRDPVYWAIAAHELGHARFSVVRPGLDRLFTWGGMLSRLLVSLGMSLGLGNMFYGLAHVTNLALVLLVSALALYSLRVVEEVIASAFAFAVLRDETQLTHRTCEPSRSYLRSRCRPTWARS